MKKFTYFVYTGLFLCIIFLNRAVSFGQCSTFPTVAVSASSTTVCAGGTVTLAASGATTYIWTNAIGTLSGNPITASPNVTTTYTVTGNSGDCSASSSITITVNPTPIVSAIASPATICQGGATEITATCTNSIGPLTYTWSPSPSFGSSMSSITPINTTTYYVIGTDANGCVGSDDVTVNVINAPLMNLTTSSTNASCSGGADGTATVTASGGTAPYTYAWNNTPQLTPSITNIPIGAYTVRVVDSNGCSQDATATVLDAPSMNLTTSTTMATCGMADGSATVIVSGGTAPYTYSWSPNTIGTTGGTTATLSNIPAGIYSVVVTDSSGCKDSANTGISTSNAPSINITSIINPSCNGSCDGLATASATGNGPFTYVWNTPIAPTTATANNLCAGTYVVAATDINGCTSINSITIAEPSPIILSTSSINPTCGASDGQATVFASGGTAPYSYIWNTAISETTSIITNLPSGIYTVIATDFNGCNSQAEAIIIDCNNRIENCVALSVSLSTWAIRPCFDNIYFYAYYSNNGTTDALNSRIEINFGNDITPLSSSLAWNAVTGTTYIFNTGPVNAGASKNFYVKTKIACSVPQGSTQCIDAHIYPDSSCVPIDPNWDKSSIRVTGKCINGQACFTIKNAGKGNMTGMHPYRIYENNMLMETKNFQLTSGDSLIVCYTTKSNTIRLEADQHSKHPGKSRPQTAIELCGAAPFVMGQITKTSGDNAESFHKTYCMIVTNSFDPNDKSVQPEGLGKLHYTDSADILTYQIRFQNTGSDTAFKVVIRDTLSQHLDIASVKSGAGSHPYTFTIYGAGILEWTFDNILLPDSTTDEVNSHGFISYSVSQKRNNPYGTLIENTAGIYFDYNDPIITNTTFNTIGKMPEIVLNNPTLADQKTQVYILPHPLTSISTISIHGDESDYVFELYDIVGKKVLNMESTNKQILFSKRNLPEGIYIYKVLSKGNVLAIGKVIIQ